MLRFYNNFYNTKVQISSIYLFLAFESVCWYYYSYNLVHLSIFSISQCHLWYRSMKFVKKKIAKNQSSKHTRIVKNKQNCWKYFFFIFSTKNMRNYSHHVIKNICIKLWYAKNTSFIKQLHIFFLFFNIYFVYLSAKPFCNLTIH